MKIFLDTSSLFKLYYREPDTHIVENILITNNVTGLFLSEIAAIEFESTIWKKVRIKQITDFQAITIIRRFDGDFSKYKIKSIDQPIFSLARTLISKYGTEGLRTLDSIQLATAVSLRNECALFVSSDNLLNTFFEQEGLAIG